MRRTQYAIMTAAMLLAASTVYSQSMGELKKRMAARTGEIAALKTQKVIGENREGYLAILKGGADAPAAKLVAAENADRKAVYAAIAARTGQTTVEGVARLRAKDIYKKATAGVMLQDEQGNWREKQ